MVSLNGQGSFIYGYEATIVRNLSDCNRSRTYNHLVRKGTLSHLAKLALQSKN